MRKQGLKLILTAMIIAVPIILLATTGSSTYDYKKVDQLSQAGKPKEAASLVAQMLQLAVDKQNNMEVLRALIYLGCLEEEYQEDALVNNINRIKVLLPKVKSPLKELMEGLLANEYQSYQNRFSYQINQRIAISANASQDIQTWANSNFKQEIRRLYREVLSVPSLQKESIQDYKQILTEMQQVKNSFQQSMYDVYAYQAISYFQYGVRSSQDQVNDFYAFDDPKLLSDAANFVEIQFPTENNSSDLEVLRIYQNLLKVHQNDKLKDAFVEANIRRMEFVASKFIGDLSAYNYSDVDQLLEQQYKQLLTTYKDSDLFTYISWKLAELYRSTANKYDASISEEHRMDFAKALKVAEEGQKAFPKSWAAQNCSSVIREIQETNFSFVSPEFVLPNQEFLGEFSFKNLEKAYIRIYKTTALEASGLVRKYNGKNLHTQIESLKKEYEKAYDLPKMKDYRDHAIELPLQALESGAYFMEISSDMNFNDLLDVKYLHFQISNMAYVNQRREDGAQEFVLMDRQSGLPLKGIESKIYKRTYNYQNKAYDFKLIDTKKTDDNGLLVISSTDENISNSSLVIEFIKGNDTFRTDQSFSVSEPYQRPERENIQIELFTDRAIYRPGQAVYYKGILLNKSANNYELNVGKAFDVRFLDVNRKEISKQSKKSDDFGGIDGSFQIPSGVLTGGFKIATPYGYINIQVEEYKRPTFQVNFDALNGHYQLGEPVEVDGDVKAFAGYPINDAKLTYRIERSRWNFPIYGYSRGYSYYSSPELVASGKLQADDMGKFSIQFDTPKAKTSRWETQIRYHYSISVDATSLSGESQHAEQSINVGNIDLELSTDLAEKSDLKAFKSFTIKSRNLNNQFIPAQGELEVYALKMPRADLRERLWSEPDLTYLPREEFIQRFPLDPYPGDLNREKWEKTSVYKTTFDTQNDSIIKLPISKWKAGNYVVVLHAKDSFGQQVSAKDYVLFFNSKDKKMSMPLADWFQVDQTRAKVGDAVNVYLGSIDKGSKALYRLYQDKKLLKEEWIKIGGKQYRINIPVEESYRGGFQVNVIHILNNRIYQNQAFVDVPFENKKLNITMGTQRDKLTPGSKEEWILKITKDKGSLALASVLASMYDASLDEFTKTDWMLDLYHAIHPSISWQSQDFGVQRSNNLQWSDHFGIGSFVSLPEAYRFFNPCGVYTNGKAMAFGSMGGGDQLRSKSRLAKVDNGVEMDMESASSLEGIIPITEHKPPPPSDSPNQSEDGKTGKPQIRRNFNETAFFYPNLMTNENGDVIVKFTLPESLTEWKFRALAYTKELEVGSFTQNFTASKDLMIAANAPRFFRSGDQIQFPASVINLSAKDLSIVVNMEILDAISEEALNGIVVQPQEQSITVKAGQTQSVHWQLNIPEGVSALTYKITASSGSFSDGEQMLVPVLTNRTMVTGTQIFELNGSETKAYQFDELLRSGESKTLSPFRLNLEFTSNPIWYAIQAIPAMSESSRESVDQLLSNYYASVMGSYIVNSNPKIKRVFDAWSTVQPDAFLSQLEKNQELKQLVLEQTPWLLDAKDETEQKRRIAAYFDLNRLSNQQETTLSKLKALQLPDGSFPWFKGMRGSKYNTQLVVKNIGKLQRKGVLSNQEINALNTMMSKAVRWLDQEILSYYNRYQKDLKKKIYYNPSPSSVEYLLIRTYLMKQIPMKADAKVAYEFLLDKAQYEWLKQDLMTQGNIALLAQAVGNEKRAQMILASLKDRALYKENMGMYWKSSNSYFWYKAPIETQALLIEVFNEIGNDQQAVNRMKQWLLKQKQTQKWPTNRATLDAVYALIFTGDNLIAADSQVKIQLGNQTIDSRQLDKEAGSGYFSKVWTAQDIQVDMGKIKVERDGKGPAWGALTFQYFEDLDQVKSSQKDIPLHIEKTLYVKETNAQGIKLRPISEQDPIAVGDEVVIQLSLRIDRDMDFVHLQDLRAAGFEPRDVISGYNWNDGLGYYQSTKDASTDFFFDSVRKGVYVFSYSVSAAQAGNYSGGIANIQSYYAPEFASHSKGERVLIK